MSLDPLGGIKPPSLASFCVDGDNNNNLVPKPVGSVTRWLKYFFLRLDIYNDRLPNSIIIGPNGFKILSSTKLTP